MPSFRSSRTRILTAIVALPAMVVIGLAVAAVLAGERSRFPCPLYPNASVALGSALRSECNLRYGQRIGAVETRNGLRVVESADDLNALMHASRDPDWRLRLVPDAGDGSRVVRLSSQSAFDTAAGLLAAFVLGSWIVAISRLTAIRAPVAAAWPFAIAYGSVGTLVAAALVGWWSAGSYPVASLARAMLAASLIDLAFVFPRERRVGVSARLLVYLACGLLCAAELHAAYFDRPTTMLLIQKLLATALLVACLLVAGSCAVASRTSVSSLERRQARVFLQGLVALGAVTACFAALDPSGGLGSAATVGAVLSPLPLGVAIARHHLFDLDLQVRRVAAHLVSSVVLASLLFVPLFALRELLGLPAPWRSAPFLFSALVCLVVPLDLLRRGLATWVEGALRPRGVSWEELSSAGDPHLLDAGDPQAVTHSLGRWLGRAFPKAHHAVYLHTADAWRLADASGPGPWLDPAMARRAAASLPWRPADLNRLALDEAGERLMDAGVHGSAPIRRGDRLYGWILIHPQRKGSMLSAGDLGFLSAAASQAAVALHHLELRERLLANERFAEQGRLHAELAHELGKPLGTLEVLAHRLAAGGQGSAVDRDAVASVARLATRLRTILRGVLAETREADRGDTVRAEELLAQAGRDVADVRGEGWIVSHPPVRPVRVPAAWRSVVRALTNLLHNAIDASSPGQTVDLRVRQRRDAIEFEVADAGDGIPAERLEGVMQPFVTTRSGGTGLGLAIARQIAESLGGRLALHSDPGRGTRARIQLTLPRAAALGAPGGGER